MKLHFLLLLPSIIAFGSVHAQEFPGDFIPPGYTVLDSAKGNLNLDAYDDYIVVLKKKVKNKRRT